MTKILRFFKEDNESNLKKRFYINFALLIILVLSVSANQIILAKVKENLGIKYNLFKKITGISISKTEEQNKTTGSASSGNIQLTGDLSKDAISLVISKGVPGVYGQELNISFDAVQQSMNIMLKFDPTNGKEKIVLTGNDLKRYIDIGLRISCEFCCGAPAIIDKNGEAACGCAHSQAMRGLAAFLIKNHGSEYSNDEILRELARWKGVYFPKQMIQKLTQQLQNGKFTPDAASLVLGLQLPDYGKGSQSAPLPSEIKDLPSMVGGC